MIWDFVVGFSLDTILTDLLLKIPSIPKTKKTMSVLEKLNPIYKRIDNAILLLRKGHFKILFRELLKRLNSESYSFGLKRDLYKEFKPSPAKINTRIRKLKKADINHLLSFNTKSVNPRIISAQRAMIAAGIPTCYVAATRDDKPCYMQWLISHKHNDKIAEHFDGIFPPLNKTEALLEGAYSNPSYRGLRIMPEAMSRIAEKAALFNARWVITFVDINNTPSLKGCKRAGFEPYLLRKTKWFFFCQYTSFHYVPAELLKKYHEETAENTAHNTQIEEMEVSGSTQTSNMRLF